MRDEAVAIILLNWNGWRDTIACLESSLELAYPNYSIIIVDNASTDASLKELDQWASTACAEKKITSYTQLHEVDIKSLSNNHYPLPHKGLTIIRAAQNGGFASGNNIGLRYALKYSTKYCWLLNNDTTVEKDALAALCKKMGDDPSIGICGSVLRYYDQPDTVQAYGGVNFDFLRARGQQLGQGKHYLDPSLKQIKDSDLTYVAGASMLLRRQFLEEIGLMQEDYFLYYEEIDWALRAKHWKQGVASGSMVFHKEGGSIGTSSRRYRSALSQYYLTRNGLRIYLRYKPALAGVAVLRCLKDLGGLCFRRQYSLAFWTCRASLAGLMNQRGKSNARF